MSSLSGKQRMLTQKMTKEALLIVKGINANENRENLKASVALFEKTLIGLQKGDETLELEKTSEKKILQQLDEVTKLWNKFKPVIDSIFKGKKDKKTLTSLADQNLPLLSAMNKAVGMYEEVSGADLNELATVINLSGRQRMLTQKMSKELLLVANDVNASGNRENLKKTVALFETTLNSLIGGDVASGLQPTKDNATLAQLSVVKTQWDEFKPLIQKVDISKESLEKVAKLNLPLLAEMNKAVKMYEELSAN